MSTTNGGFLLSMITATGVTFLPALSRIACANAARGLGSFPNFTSTHAPGRPTTSGSSSPCLDCHPLRRSSANSGKTFLISLTTFLSPRFPLFRRPLPSIKSTAFGSQ